MAHSASSASSTPVPVMLGRHPEAPEPGSGQTGDEQDRFQREVTDSLIDSMTKSFQFLGSNRIRIRTAAKSIASRRFWPGAWWSQKKNSEHSKFKLYIGAWWKFETWIDNLYPNHQHQTAIAEEIAVCFPETHLKCDNSCVYMYMYIYIYIYILSYICQCLCTSCCKLHVHVHHTISAVCTYRTIHMPFPLPSTRD